MKKRRSTVFVRPGKDVTLYIPVDTSPEVINLLNRLKEDGTFSQGVMDILTQYVQGQTMPTSNPPIFSEEAAVSLESDLRADRDIELQPAPEPKTPGKLNLAQIFRQAQRNAGKLSDSRENN